MHIVAQEMDFAELNRQIRASEDEVHIDGCCGQRFLGCGLAGRRLTITGTPGNALGAYLDGAEIEVYGNVQDAVGDTMNDGVIAVHGNAGDALGYAMRGGVIFVRGDAGYRAGIHMKEYREKKPVLVIGGRAGSFLGEYLAGGLIVVLGLGAEGAPVGGFPGTGMHGGRILLRADAPPDGLPAQVTAEPAGEEELRELAPYITAFAGRFGMEPGPILSHRFWSLRPNAKNPYQRLYTAN